MPEDEKNEEETEETTAAKSEDELGDGGKKALDAERKARRNAEKELKELRSKVQEIEDKDKSENERLQSQVAELTKRAEAAEATVDRFEVAAAKGLTPAQARRLVGSTKEELEADADEMRAELGLDKEEEKSEEEESTNEEQGLGLPKEDLKEGASNAGDAQPDASKLADDILKSGW